MTIASSQGPDEKAHRVSGGDYWNLSKLGPHAPGEVGPVVRKMIESVDRSVGQIVAALRRLGLRRRTLVLFTSDNGGYLSYSGRHRGEISSNGPLRGQKGDVYEGGHRVPAIASWPGRIDAGVTTNATAMTMDLLPTFLELPGLDTPAPDDIGAVDGVSLAPLLLRNELPPPRMLFWRIGNEKAVRDGDWKLVVEKQRAPSLYNLADDIGERHNLAAADADRVRELTKTLQEWERRVDPN